MIVYRLTNEKYKEDLTGRGAELAGGRWNYKGTPLLYTSSSRALCMAEVAVHTPLGKTPLNYFILEIEIPKGSMKVLKEKDMPQLWRSFPHFPTTRNIGNDFAEANKKLVLKVPSAVVQGDFNYLINPKHKLMSKVKIVKAEPFTFDKRLFDR